VKVELSSTNQVVDLENPVMRPYCGPNNLKPILAYTLFRDFNNGNFVFERLHDPFLVFVWMGKT
jgi:hypothetical protein